MDLSIEKEGTALGSLFQQIISDMKNTSPLWEDFVAKASKLHACLRAAIQAITAYLDAFQKIADAATNSKGGSKDIGTALTRVCLRHKAVETRLKTFTSAIMDCLVLPLQERIEDWKRHVATIDKDHAKEYKRCRTELKKRSTDTLRLQKKARKGQTDKGQSIQSLVDSHMQDVTQRRAELEEVERKSLRSAMIEERRRYCTFVNMLQPVVKEECEVMSELGHLQEAMQSIANVTKEPDILPQTSEELILESKSSFQFYPESPGGNSGSQGCSNSLGSRKSSVCSISSMNSSGSGSGSPGHHYQRSLSQLVPPTMRLKPGESSDSGFCSSPALTAQASSQANQSIPVSTWPPLTQDGVQTADRPHTISTTYEKGHQRPPLTVYTFQSPETIMESQKSPATIPNRPPLPVRCSSLERPLSATGPRNSNPNLIQRQCPSPLPPHITKELSQHQPTYVNMSELASMAAMKQTNQQQQFDLKSPPPTTISNVPGSDSTIQKVKEPKQPPPKPVRNINTSSTSSADNSPKFSVKQQQQLQQQQQQIQQYSTTYSTDQNNFAGTATGIITTATTDSMTTTVAAHHNDNIQKQCTQSIEQLELKGAEKYTNSPSTNNILVINENIPNNNYSNNSFDQDITSQSNLQYQQQEQQQQPQSIVNQTNPFTCNITSDLVETTEITSPHTPPTITSPTSISSTTSNITSTSSNNTITNTISSTNPNTINQINNDDILKITENNDLIINGENSSITTNSNNSTASAASTTANNSPSSSSTCTNNDLITNSNSNENSIEVRVDEKARGSVLEKMSMFEQASKAAQTNSMIPTPKSSHSTSGESLYGTIKDKESQKSSSASLAVNDKDPDQIYEDSIKELNNLIGELDSFQREHEMKEKAARKQNGIAPTQLLSNIDYNASPFQFQITTVTNTILNLNGVSGNNTNTNSILNHDYNHTKQNDGLHKAMIAGGNCNGSLETDNGSDKISIASLNYSTQSTGNISGSDIKFAYSDSEISRYISEDTNSIGGFENPTFNHLNNNCSNNPSIGGGSISGTDEYDNSRIQFDTDSGHHVMIFDQSYPITPDIEYVSKNSEIVVLRCKENINDLKTTTEINSDPPPKQRLSSFKSEQFSSSKPVTPISSNVSLNSLYGGLESPALINSNSVASTFRKQIKQQIPPPPPPVQPANTNANISQPKQQQQQENQLQTSPKNPSRISTTANESSSSGCVTRIARRSSINSNKPPPPVRRSSSVTPSHNLSTPNSPSLNQQNLHSTSSAESLPPPPAYLLDRQQQNQSPSTVNVAETVKALAAIRHTPASPSAVRRTQQQVGTIQNNKSISNATSSPMNEIPLGSNSIYNNQSNNTMQQQQQYQQQQQPQQQQQNQYHNQYQYHQNHQHHHHNQSQQYQTLPKNPISSNTPCNNDSNYNNSTFRTNPNSPGIYAQPKQITKMSSFRSPSSSASHSATGSPLGTAKPNPSLIAQLNARLTSSGSQTKQSPTHQLQNDSTKYQSYDQKQYYSNSDPNSPHHHQSSNQHYNQQESLYSRGSERYSTHHQQQTNYEDFSSGNESNLSKTGSIRGKSKAEFLENLNAKLAKQGLSGRALSVRNLINSKALPDPRICHESLMDQIKRGATLKRNQKINDRSAPKIR